MRIDAYNKVSQVYNANNVKKATKPSGGSFSDKLEISQKGQDYRVAKQIVTQTPDVREDKVNQIKKQIESGTYNINMTDVADKVVNRYFDELV
ncbi:MAG: flagellar biosynthesis anti-sigma factor FlgM [Clostridiales bacterium]|jgi:negative regulator of flagellin synthesis FlgM|nr:flagellar biosynthesis anti-sigma factor FlgM [Clostridiales bacterium]